jgi:hypothetical protein
MVLVAQALERALAKRSLVCRPRDVIGDGRRRQALLLQTGTAQWLGLKLANASSAPSGGAI